MLTPEQRSRFAQLIAGFQPEDRQDILRFFETMTRVSARMDTLVVNSLTTKGAIQDLELAQAEALDYVASLQAVAAMLARLDKTKQG